MDLAFGTSLGLTSAKGSLSLTLFNVFGNVSCFVVGYMSDKYDIWLLTLSSLVLSCLSTFVLWGICSYSLSGILAYSSIYGAVAGGFSSLWSASVRPIASKCNALVSYLLLILWQQKTTLHCQLRSSDTCSSRAV